MIAGRTTHFLHGCRELLRMTVPRLEMYCQGDKKRDLSAALYRAIRLEAARVDSGASFFFNRSMYMHKDRIHARIIQHFAN